MSRNIRITAIERTDRDRSLRLLALCLIELARQVEEEVAGQHREPLPAGRDDDDD